MRIEELKGKAAKTVDAIAESLMKCGKVKDMAEAFRTVTGRDFTGRIVGVKKDNLSYDMAREIKMQFERESFAALTVSEKITFLSERDAYDTGRFLTVCRVEELREIARSIGADTAGVRTDYEMAEKLDYISAIQEKLLFRIGYAQHQPAEEKRTTQVAEIAPVSDNDTAMASQPAIVASSQSETTAQPETALAEIVQTEKHAFIPGNVYAYRYSCSVDPHYCKITAKTDKTICYVKYNCDEIIRAKLRSDKRGEYFYVGKSALVHADDLTDADSNIVALFNSQETPSSHYEKTVNNEVIPVEAANLYDDDSYSDALGDNSQPEQDIPECHMADENEAWTDEDFYSYFPNGEMAEPELIELTLEELDALNEYLARKDAEKWKELDGIRARQKYPLVLVKKGYVPPEDMMLYPIGMYDSYEEMKIALDKNFEMVDRCKDGTDMQYLFYTCNLHTAYMMVKARGYETRFEEWQSIKDNVVHDFIRQELARRENFLKRETISQKKEEITAMLNRYAEINGTVRAIHDGIKIFRKGIKIRERQGLPVDGLEKAIKEVREKYREWRIEGFKLRQKLLRVISAEEIRCACEMYIARCERIRRRRMCK